MGIIYVVGMGPGKKEGITREAEAAIAACDVLCGYTVYINLLKEAYGDKEIITTPMRQEQKRCEAALASAASGKTVCMVCSGDAGVYGMSGLLLELQPNFPEVEIITIPGVTAALSGAAILGAPLMNDFCVISLSDLLTPWEVVEKRLHGAGMGDFAIAIYNPMSHRRTDNLRKACDILLQYKSPDTVCGWVQNIGREGQCKKLLSLAELRDESVDMFTTVFVGTDSTRVIADHMVTPRGYLQ